jgi:hypothetical protein
MGILKYLLCPPDVEPEDPPLSKPPQEGAAERERRHINREDDPHFDPTDKVLGGGIPGARSDTKP